MKSRVNLGNVPEILIYDEIGPYDSDDCGYTLTAAWIKAQLDMIGAVPLILVRINCPGGDITEGMAIYNLLHQSAPQIHVYIDGMAVSTAGWVAMAGDRVLIAEGAVMMLHPPYSGVKGYAQDLRREADVLDSLQQSIAGIFSAKTGKPVEEIVAMMQAETWLNAAEAVAAGFCDEVISNKKPAAELPANFEPKRYRNMPTWLKAEIAKQPDAVVLSLAQRRRELDLLSHDC